MTPQTTKKVLTIRVLRRLLWFFGPGSEGDMQALCHLKYDPPTKLVARQYWEPTTSVSCVVLSR